MVETLISWTTYYDCCHGWFRIRADFNKLKVVGLKPLYAGLGISLFISLFSFVLTGLLYA